MAKVSRAIFRVSFIVLSVILPLCLTQVSETFPDDFEWGVGTSSYQIEGAWNVDGKGESIWDYMTHKFPEKIVDKSNGDISTESYKHWKSDVRLVHELGVKIYRFSISWPRILPTGHINNVNKAGIDHYNNIINELLAYNITPFVTMYHWELPQKLQELGGFTNEEIVDTFVDYARILLQEFGDRVKMWTTFNEPWHVCEQAYGQDYMAPSYDYPGVPSYLCGHNLLKAHAKVYHMYKNKFQDQNGVMGITADISSPHALSHTHEDHQAVQRAFQFYVGWFMHPIFSTHGNYPKIMIDRIGELSRVQGFSKSRLPTFTDDEIKMIHNTSDFFGINSYTSVLVTTNDDKNNPGGHPVPSFAHDMGTIESQDDHWEKSGSVWLRPHPSGMRHLLNWIKNEYNNPPVYITENGVSDRGGLNDIKRIEYFHSYLTAILSAIKDGCNIKGYIAWSLMDSYEWKAGYTEKFGLYHVDLASPNKTRTPKASALVFKRMAETNRIDYSYKPTVPELSTEQKGNNFDMIHIIIFSVLCVMLIVIICCITMICIRKRRSVSNRYV